MRNLRKISIIILMISILGIIGQDNIVEVCVANGKEEEQVYVGEKNAKRAMQKKVPNGTIVNFSYNEGAVRPKFEGLVIKNAKEYYIEVDAITGFIVKCNENKINEEHEEYKGKVITVQEAREIMLERTGGGVIQVFNYDGSGEIPIYEGEIVNGVITTGIMIDARDGKIIGIQK